MKATFKKGDIVNVNGSKKTIKHFGISKKLKTPTVIYTDGWWQFLKHLHINKEK